MCLAGDSYDCNGIPAENIAAFHLLLLPISVLILLHIYPTPAALSINSDTFLIAFLPPPALFSICYRLQILTITFADTRNKIMQASKGMQKICDTTP